MALTLEQWKLKLEAMLPKWFFEEVGNQEDIIYGWAKIFSELEADIDAHIDETFITAAVNSFLDAHGGERNVTRLTNELNAQYRVRIRNLTNQSNKPAIKLLVDGLLQVGESTIREDWQGGIFVNREEFINRGSILIDPLIMNTSTIIIDKQIHAPYSFVDREYFCDREDFVGTINSSDYILNLIVEAVNSSKALGTLYRLIERGE